MSWSPQLRLFGRYRNVEITIAKHPYKLCISVSIYYAAFAPNASYAITWWCIGRFDAFRLKSRGFESGSIRHLGIVGKSFTRSCLGRFGVKLRHNIRAVSGAPSLL